MFNTAEIILLFLLALNVLLGILVHDKPKGGKHNALADFIQACLTVGLLYWAGLFH